jgi:hypothetical protein
MLIAVEIKFTAPKIEEAPAKCREKIAKSTLPPPWATIQIVEGRLSSLSQPPFLLKQIPAAV